MKVEIVGKNGFKPSEENKDYITSKLQKVGTYFSDQNLNARVVAKVYPTYQKVEVTIPTKNVVLRAEAKAQDVYAALDLAIEKLDRQISKYKTRVKDKKGKDALKETFAEEYFASVKAEAPAKVVRTKNITLVPLTDEEALDELELTGHDFFLYLDSETLKVKVVYVREDGDYAILLTE